MRKITAIYGGMDWYDASVVHLVLPLGMDIGKEHEQYRAWYRDEYCPAHTRGEKPEYQTFADWLIDRGAESPGDDEIEHFDEC